MLMEKVRHGVLQVSTAHGPRFVDPSLVERIRLLWMFRNFKLLPPEVLNEQERAMVHHLCERQQRRNDVNPDLVIGIVEQQDSLPPKKRVMPTAHVRQHTA